MRFFFCCVLLLSMFMGLKAQADTISLRSDSWCPYNCAPDAKKLGYGIEVLKAIFEKEGHTLDYQLMNWTRSIERGRAGDHTAIIGARKEEAPDFIFPTEPIGNQGNKLAILKDSTFSYNGTTSLADKRLAVIQSYSYNDTIDAYVKKNAGNKMLIDAATGDDALEKNLSKLVAGRVDVVIDDSSVLTYKINEMQISDQVKLVNEASEPTAIYVAFSPKNPKAKDYAALFDKGIEELRTNGKLRAILDRYGLADWK